MIYITSHPPFFLPCYDFFFFFFNSSLPRLVVTYTAYVSTGTNYVVESFCYCIRVILLIYDQVVKPLLQERTKKKVQVLSGCGRDELLKVNFQFYRSYYFVALCIVPFLSYLL